MELKNIDLSAKVYIIEKYWEKTFKARPELINTFETRAQNKTKLQRDLMKVLLLLDIVFKYGFADIEKLTSENTFEEIYDVLLTEMESSEGFVTICIAAAKSVHVYHGEIQTLH